MKKFIQYFSVFCLLAISLTACGSQKKSLNKLVVGLQAGYPPFESVDEKGHFIGFDIDISKELAKKMGKELQVVEMGFDGLILSLKNKKIDLIVSGMSITPERLKHISMVPYFGENQESLMMIFWKQGTEIKGLEDLSNKVIAVQSGTFQEGILQNYPDIQAKALENVTDLIMDIEYQKSYAAIVEAKTAQNIVVDYPNVVAVPVPLKPNEEVMGFGIGVHPDNQNLISDVSNYINQMQESQKIDELAQKWFKGNSAHD